jgi:hypothetical protein
MCHATGANSNFGLIAIVRTNRMSCIMLKIVKEPKLNSRLFPCSLKQIMIACLVLFSLFRCRCVVMLKFIRVDGLDCGSRLRIFRLGDLNLG